MKYLQFWSKNSLRVRETRPVCWWMRYEICVVTLRGERRASAGAHSLSLPILKFTFCALLYSESVILIIINLFILKVAWTLRPLATAIVIYYCATHLLFYIPIKIRRPSDVITVRGCDLESSNRNALKWSAGKAALPNNQNLFSCFRWPVYRV